MVTIIFPELIKEIINTTNSDSAYPNFNNRSAQTLSHTGNGKW